MSKESKVPGPLSSRKGPFTRSTNAILTLVLPALVCVQFLGACGGTPVAKGGGGGIALSPLQPGQPPQKPGPELVSQFSQVAPVAGGQPGNVPVSFAQPFRLGDLEYQFIGSTGKKYVGLAESPAMQADAGSDFFVVRYMVTNRGDRPVIIPNQAAVHLYDLARQAVIDIDQGATDANIVSGAATGLPEGLELAPGVANIQTLVYKVKANTKPQEITVLVTEPSNPNQLFQQVKLSQ